MKSFIIFFACILVALTACKKHTDVVIADSMSADIDGVGENFNTRPTATFSGSSTIPNANLVLFAGNGSTASSDAITISFFYDKAITTGTYTSGVGSVYVSIGYKNGPSTPENLNFYTSINDGSNPSTIVITKLTSTNLQGTFSGKLVYGSLSKTITNGKFNITLK